MRDYFTHELLEFEIVQPDTVVEVGTSKWPAFLAVVAAEFFLIFAAIALVEEGPRLIKGYDSNKQMEAAEAGGFSDKETFLAAQAAGISTAGDWGKFLSDMSKAGFDNPSEFIAFREQEKAKKEKRHRDAEEQERRERANKEKAAADSYSPSFGLGPVAGEVAHAFYYCVRTGPSKLQRQFYFFRPSREEAQRGLDSSCNLIHGGGGAIITEFQN
ncbi:hypothetical protein [Altererythrobacter litoralis]